MGAFVETRTLTFGGAALAGSLALVAAIFYFIQPTPAPAPQRQATADIPAPAAPAPVAAQPAAAPMAEARPEANMLVGTAGDDALTGTSGDDVIDGAAGNDRLYAATETSPEGVDRLIGGAGDDRLYVDALDSFDGGPGVDHLVVRDAAGMTAVLAGAGIEETWGGSGPDSFDGSGVIDAALALRGGAGDDRLVGGALDDRLYGGDGADRLEGGPGADVLKGEAGDDTLTGGPGADVFNYPEYDGSTDIITDYSAAEGDTVSAADAIFLEGEDTVVVDSAQNRLFILKNYDGAAGGVLLKD